jgi:hypothetical protein
LSICICWGNEAFCNAWLQLWYLAWDATISIGLMLIVWTIHKHKGKKQGDPRTNRSHLTHTGCGLPLASHLMEKLPSKGKAMTGPAVCTVMVGSCSTAGWKDRNHTFVSILLSSNKHFNNLTTIMGIWSRFVQCTAGNV